MSRDAAAVLVLGAIGLVVLAALGLGLSGGRQTTEVSDIRAPDPSAGVAVSGLRVEEGMSVFGIRVRPSKYHVLVQLTAGAGCFDLLEDGARWPLDGEECRSDVAIDGTVSGSGRTASGATIVFVEREITRGCYEALQSPGAATWPLPEEACGASG